jgi:hypothetical protein
LGSALVLALNFVIATIITMLTSFTLRVLSEPFGSFGNLVYIVLQGIIVAALFLPIANDARKLKTMVLGSETEPEEDHGAKPAEGVEGTARIQTRPPAPILRAPTPTLEK